MSTPIRNDDPAFATTVRRRRHRGSYTMFFALLLPVIVAGIGLTVDMSHYWWVEGQLRNAADAAAFAGAKELNSTNGGRTRAATVASTHATHHKADGVLLEPSEVVEKQTGEWRFSDQTFQTTAVSDASANAVRVTVRRQNVPTFFAPLITGTATTQTLTATATAVAGGARAVSCAAPITLGACVLDYDSNGKLICPTNLSFQNGAKSVGLTHPDGTSPVNGNNTKPYIKDAVDNPLSCSHGAAFGDTLYLQNGNDLAKQSIDDINAATNGGANPIPAIFPVIDISCGSGGPTYNQSSKVVGFVKMRIVGARWTGSAPALVQAACPTLGKKNVCVTADCSAIEGAPGGGTINANGARVYLVR